MCLALTGCGSGVSATSAVPIAPAPAQTHLPFSTPTEQPLPTNSPVALITATTTPPATPEPTLPPLPTSANSALQIWRLLANNGGCRLPCFWGITPGKTTTAGFLQFMSQFPNESEWMGRSRGMFRVYYIPPLRNTDTTLTVEFFEQNSMIEAVVIDGYTVPLSFPLTRLLQEYGMPDQVLFGGNMYVLYEQQRIVAEYELSIQDNYLCYDPQRVAGIVTWAEGRDWMSAVNRFLDVLGPKVSVSSLKPIDQVTEYDLASFYKKFSAANRSICMKTLTPNP